MHFDLARFGTLKIKPQHQTDIMKFIPHPAPPTNQLSETNRTVSLASAQANGGTSLRAARPIRSL